MSFLNSLLGVGGVLAAPFTGGASLALTGAALTNSANASNAKDAFNRSLDASNTSYQRGVADLEAAGLNPMLAYGNGGASVPNAPVAAVSDYGQAFNAGRQTSSNVSTQSAQAANLASQTTTNATQAQLNSANVVKTAADTAKSKADTIKSIADASVSNATAARINQDMRIKAPEDVATTKGMGLINDLLSNSNSATAVKSVSPPKYDRHDFTNPDGTNRSVINFK